MKKFIKIASILAALSLFAGCKTQLNPNIETDDSAYIKISTDDNFVRTIEPDWESIEKDNYIYELWGSRQGSIYNVKLGTWLSYKDLTEAAAIKIEPDTWTFELTARKNHTLEFSGSIERKAIKAGKTTLNFILSDRNGPDGYGQIDYKFYFNQPFDYTGYAELMIYNSDGTKYITPEADISEANVKNECSAETIDGVDYKYVTYKNDKIKKGFYTVEINVYDENSNKRKLLNRYTTTIRVAKDLTSSGVEFLTKRNYKADISDITPELYFDYDKTYGRPYIYWHSINTATSVEIYEYETDKDLSVYDFDTSKFTAAKESVNIDFYPYYNLTQKLSKNIYYAVKGVNDKGKSQFSNVLMVQKGLPPVSINLTGKELTWSAVSDAKKYEVYKYSTWSDYKAEDLYMGNFSDPVAVISDNTYEITLDTTNYTYYAVKAVSGDVKTDFSRVYRVKPFIAPVVSKSNGTVSWSSVDGASGYKVYSYRTTESLSLSEFDKSNFDTYEEAWATEVGYELSTTEYTYYAVKGFNGDLETDFSNVIVVAPFLPPVISINEKGIVSWSPVSGATSYRICYFSSETKIDLSPIDFSTEDYTETFSSLTSYTFSASMTNYLYCAVQAYYDGLYTDFSNVVEFEKFDTVADYLSLVKGAAYGEAYTVQENDSKNIEDFTLVEWSSLAGTFLSFAVEPNTTYYLDGVDGYSGSYNNVTPTYSGSGLGDAYYDIYTDQNFSTVISGKDTPSDTYFTTSATASTYYIVVRPYGSYETGKAYFRIYKETTN